jgi:hypothetical protein
MKRRVVHEKKIDCPVIKSNTHAVVWDNNRFYIRFCGVTEEGKCWVHVRILDQRIYYVLGLLNNMATNYSECLV